MTHAITVVLKPGYAPIEQYGDVASMAQGAWTDLYTLGVIAHGGIGTNHVDVAVIAVDSGDAPTLPFDTSVESKEGVAILGFPQDGPYDVQPGRVRSQQRLRSPNIYGEGAVIRDVLSLRGKVRPGNSGGPVVTSAGEVAGLIFAASLTDDDTGYALTAGQVGEAATLGVSRGAPADTGDCAG